MNEHASKIADSDQVGHRARLRQRLLDAGPEGFHDYELIEYLLAVHPYRCAAVLARLGDADRALLNGVPELCRVVLDQLAGADPRAAELVKLRFFAGLTGEQAAEALGISPRSADLLWAYARAWLFEKLKSERC